MKDMEEKMLMITEIMKSEEDGELKLQMIAEVLDISKEVPPPKQEETKPTEEAAVQE